MINFISKIGALSILVGFPLLSQSLVAFGNCSGDEYNDPHNRRCIYGTCDGKCSTGYKPVLDARVGLCMYCEKGYMHSNEAKTCVKVDYPAGTYTKTCTDIKYDLETDVLTASCLDKTQVEKAAKLENAWACNGEIQNLDGELKCGVIK